MRNKTLIALSMVAFGLLPTLVMAAVEPRSAQAPPNRVAAAAGGARSYVAGNYMLELDGVKLGFVKSFEGGDVQSEVINESVGADNFVRKHIGPPRYNDIVLKVGFNQGKPLYDWIAASWQMNVQRKNGAIISANYDMDAKTRLEFFNALITETTIPACDGASKDPAYMTIRITPESTRSAKASGKLSGEVGKNEQTMWLPQNFRLDIPGLDTTKVNKIDAITVKQGVASDNIGDARDTQRVAGKLEFPNLSVTLSEVSAVTWMDWHQDFVIAGNNSQDKEKAGSLVLLSANRQAELLKINFFNMGIFKLATERSEANSDAIKRWNAQLYVERMELVPHGQKVGRLPGNPRS